MSEFMKILIETTERFQDDIDLEFDSLREKERKALSKPLLPVVRELDKLTALGVKFHDGTPFGYSVFTKGPLKGSLEILTKYPCFILYWPTEGQGSFGFRYHWGWAADGSKNASKDGGTEISTVTYDSVEDLLVRLAGYLGAFIGTLGLADKSVYSKNVQDTIGID
jgi:hypothetical protein